MKKNISHQKTNIVRKRIKYILVITISIFSYFMNAQSKYEFDIKSISSFDSKTKFYGVSKNRETVIEWNKDIWLSPKKYTVDSISKKGFLKIYDTYKGEKHFLEIKPIGEKLSYNYTINEIKANIPFTEKNEWYKSLCEEVINNYLKATFYKRFHRNYEELFTVKVGSKFPYFDKLDINNNKISSGDLKDKITVINFWNIKCIPCIKEMPDLNRIMEEYNKLGNYKFIAFTFNTKEQIENLFASRKDVKFDYLQIPSSGDIQNALGIRFNPISFILDGDGTILYMKVGYSHKNISDIEKILKEKNIKKKHN